ncbi:hypothetical protein [Sphingomonas profundi]|uniref:hypothetical protein n=1 Tax=Alterirhizorhabdus profundi TaxID=2681549 RepID=UPI0018D1723D|nr:hypothetical protein [Sphingomonas profundi]
MALVSPSRVLSDERRSQRQPGGQLQYPICALPAWPAREGPYEDVGGGHLRAPMVNVPPWLDDAEQPVADMNTAAISNVLFAATDVPLLPSIGRDNAWGQAQFGGPPVIPAAAVASEDRRSPTELCQDEGQKEAHDRDQPTIFVRGLSRLRDHGVHQHRQDRAGRHGGGRGDDVRAGAS